jgi:hypothetical protein
MKPMLKAAVLITLLISAYSSNAQIISDRRPPLFSAFANTISIPTPELEKIFNTPQGNVIKLSLADNFSFTGSVISSLKRYNNLHSVVIRLNNLDSTIFGVSKRINDDKSISYIGRIINTKYGDAFELKTDAGGNYFINKIKTENLIEDHN